MFDNIDTRKWVCVEATEKQAAVCGDLVLFVMLNPEYGVTCDQIVESFTTLCGGTVDSVNDHRIAMSAAVAALLCSHRVELAGAQAVEKSYPAFWADYERLCGEQI